MDVLNAARSKRAEKFAQKQAVENRVRLGEERMAALRQELLDAERDLQIADDDVDTLQQNFMEAPPAVAIGVNDPMFIPDDSESSEDLHPEHSVLQG